MTVSDSAKHAKRCMRCGAPASAGADLRAITRLPARHKVGRRHPSKSDSRRREPYGFVHEDRAFCAKRMPNARRNPFDGAVWGAA